MKRSSDAPVENAVRALEVMSGPGGERVRMVEMAGAVVVLVGGIFKWVNFKGVELLVN